MSSAGKPRGPNGPRGPPRFVSPIAAAKIRKADPPPSIYELQESLTAAAPAEMAATEIGTGVGVSGAPGGTADIVPTAAPATTPAAVTVSTVPTAATTAKPRAPRTAATSVSKEPVPAVAATSTPAVTAV